VVEVPVERIVKKPIYKENVITRQIPKIVKQEVIYETEKPVE